MSVFCQNQNLRFISRLNTVFHGRHGCQKQAANKSSAHIWRKGQSKASKQGEEHYFSEVARGTLERGCIRLQSERM